MSDILIIIVVIITAFGFVWADYNNRKSLVYILKPATTLLIIILAILQDHSASDNYKIFIVTGLIFSLIGDVFLMLPRDRFILGLVSFFIAHIFYIGAFTSGFNTLFDLIYSVPAIIFAISFLWLIIPKTGKLKVPVIVYAIMLVLFLWQATGRYFSIVSISAIYSFTGAVLFIISDSVLGYSRFVRSVKSNTIAIHSTYWGAQLLLALSI